MCGYHVIGMNCFSVTLQKLKYVELHSHARNVTAPLPPFKKLSTLGFIYMFIGYWCPWASSKW